MRSFVALLSLLVVVQGGWVDLFKFPWSGVPLELMLDVSCPAASDCFVPGSTGASAEAVWYTKNDFKTMTNATMHKDGLMLLAIAMGDSKNGVVGGIGALKLPGILYTKDGGSNWGGSLDILPVETQDMVTVGGTKDFGFIGETDILSGGEGCSTSLDGGYIWEAHTWPKDLKKQLPANCSVRYGSLPSLRNIYMTCGSWPNTNNTKNLRIDEQAGKVEFDISSRWTLNHHINGKSGKNGKKAYLESRARPTVSNQVVNNGYTAGIVKSEDGGKTWAIQYQSIDNFYFNDICCMSETNCIAVGEGFAQDGAKQPGGHIMTTSDGKTWKQTALIPGSSILRCAAVGPNEAFAAVSYQAGGIANLKAEFYKTTDGGKTFAIDSSVKGIDEVMGMDFVNSKLGYAVGITELKITTAMKYTA